MRPVFVCIVYIIYRDRDGDGGTMVADGGDATVGLGQKQNDIRVFDFDSAISDE